MFKKIIAFLMSLVLVLGVSVTSGYAQLIGSGDDGTAIHAHTSTLEVLERVGIMEEYVTISANGALFVNPSALQVVPESVYKMFVLGADKINVAVSKGLAKIEGNSLVPLTNLTTTRIDTDYFSNTYWWGIAVTYNQSETKQMLYVLETYQNSFALAAALAGLIPGGQAFSAASAILAFGNWALIRSINTNNIGYGVTLNFHWLPLPWLTVTGNQGPV